jgi:hypothetical protein
MMRVEDGQRYGWLRRRIEAVIGSRWVSTRRMSVTKTILAISTGVTVNRRSLWENRVDCLIPFNIGYFVVRLSCFDLAFILQLLGIGRLIGVFILITPFIFKLRVSFGSRLL